MPEQHSSHHEHSHHEHSHSEHTSHEHSSHHSEHESHHHSEHHSEHLPEHGSHHHPEHHASSHPEHGSHHRSEHHSEHSESRSRSSSRHSRSEHSEHSEHSSDKEERARKVRARKAIQLNDAKRKYHKLSARKEAYEKEQKKQVKKAADRPSAPEARITPAVLYLEGLFALLLVIAHTQAGSRSEGTVWNTLLFQSAVPALLLLLGYRIARRAEEVKVKQYDAPFFSYILNPSLSLYIIPWVITYGVFLLLRKAFTGEWGAFSENGLSFLGCDYGPSAYFGLMALQLILFFPAILIIRKQTEEFRRKRKKKKKKKSASRSPLPWPLHIAGFVILYELFVNWVGISPAAYRLFACRSLLAFALGIYTYQTRHKDKNRLLYALLFVAGILYMVGITLLTSHGGGNMPTWMPLFQGWAYTNAASCLYFFPPIAILLRKVGRKALPRALDTPLRLLGKASYYIVVVQAAYFAINLNLPISPFVHAVLDLFLCLAAALLLYALSLLPIAKVLKTAGQRSGNGTVAFLSGIKSTVVIRVCRIRMNALGKRIRRLTK